MEIVELNSYTAKLVFKVRSSHLLGIDILVLFCNMFADSAVFVQIYRQLQFQDVVSLLIVCMCFVSTLAHFQL